MATLGQLDALTRVYLVIQQWISRGHRREVGSVSKQPGRAVGWGGDGPVGFSGLRPGPLLPSSGD